MTKEQLEQLREQAKAKLAATTIAMREQQEVRRLNSILTGTLGTAMAKQAIVAETSKLLTSLIDDCTGLVASMPIYSKATREQRKFNPSRVYSYGNQVGNLLALLSGIQYSAADHKQLLLAHVGLSEDLIEQTLEAFGAVSYYSNNHNIVIPEQPYDAEQALACVEMIEAELNITIDKSKLTPAIFSKSFELARITAEAKAAAAELAIMKTIKVGE